MKMFAPMSRPTQRVMWLAEVARGDLADPSQPALQRFGLPRERLGVRAAVGGEAERAGDLLELGGGVGVDDEGVLGRRAGEFLPTMTPLDLQVVLGHRC